MKRSVKIPVIILAVAALATLVIFLLGPERRRLTPKVRENSGSGFIELSEGWTEYELSGPADGEPVVFIHGLSVPMYDWDDQFDFFASRGYRVLRYNQYGRGLSDRPRGTYDAERYVRQLKDLLDSQGWESAHLVAHSMGAAVTVEFNRSWPGMVDETVLISPSYHLAEDHGGIAATRIPVVGDLMAKVVLSDILAARAEELLVRSGIANTTAYMETFNEQTQYIGFTRSVKSMFRNNVVEEMDKAYRTLEGSRTGLIWGTEDASIPRKHIDRIVSLVPGIRVEVLDGAAHSPNQELPGRVNSLVLDFLEN